MGGAVHKHATVRTVRPKPSATFWTVLMSVEAELTFRQLWGLRLLKWAESDCLQEWGVLCEDRIVIYWVKYKARGYAGSFTFTILLNSFTTTMRYLAVLTT